MATVGEGEPDMEQMEKMMKSFKDDMMKELRKAVEEVKNDGKETREDVRKVRENWEKWEENWQEEKGEIWEKMKEMEQVAEEKEKERRREEEETRKKIESLERNGERIDVIERRLGEMARGGEGGGGEVTQNAEGGEGMEERVWELEWREERLERQRRRKNIVIRRIQLGEGDVKEKVMQLLTVVMGIQVEIQWVRKIGRKDKDGGEAVVVGLKDEGQKIQVMSNKVKLKGRKERLENDLTFRERSIQWQLENVANAEMRLKKVVRVGRGRIWITGKLWIWQERKNDLRNAAGEVWKEVVAPAEQSNTQIARGDGKEAGNQSAMDLGE